ncbi:MAG: hypothetical protein AB1416_06540 [Actinomycetota bacterium]
MSERPRLHEDEVWAVLLTLEEPPHRGGDALALALVRARHPAIKARTVKLILKEWREYAELEEAGDWEDDEG